jgi:hypothetical protein
MIRTILGVAAALAIVAYLVRRALRERDRRHREPERFFGRAQSLLTDPTFEDTGSVGLPRLVGRYEGFAVQVQVVVDTLATRRLPALWLLVTLQDPLPVQARFDLMMRPTGPTTFSNFDLLPVTLQRPPDFPEHAVLRTDDEDHVLPAHVVAGHLDLFESPRAKELLITANGVRLVWLVAEASRARYGVFREADFGESDVDPQILGDLLARLIAIRGSILQWAALSAGAGA